MRLNWQFNLENIPHFANLGLKFARIFRSIYLGVMPHLILLNY